MNGPKRLSTLFKECVLRVPPYQRAYAWSPNPNLESFLEDLRNHPADQEKSYFYGTILLSKARDLPLRHLTGYDIVDGQQRITTACIFIASVIERLRKEPDLCNLADVYYETFIKDRIDGRKFKTIQSDDGFFERYILSDGSCGTDKFLTPSQRRLSYAKDFFIKATSEMAAEDIARLVTTLHDSQILVYAVASDVEATQIFELQNDRGKALTNLEALKSFLMYGLYLHAKEDISTDLPIVQSDFAAIYRAAEEMEGMYDSRDEDQLLADHCIAFEEWRTISESDGWSQPKQLMRKLLQEVPDIDKGEWIKRFSQRLHDSFQIARQILEARDNEHNIPVGELTALGRTAAFWPLMLKCWKYDKKVNRPDFDRAVRAMERFAFRAIIGGKRSNKGNSELRWWASNFVGDFETLILRLNTMRDEDGILESFQTNLDSEHFFEWWGGNVTYLLWRYENYLRTKTGQQMPRLSWKQVVLPKSVAVKYQRDHIEAKDPTNPNLSLLVKWHPLEEERPFGEVCLHRLGNLVLDTYSAGSAKGNGDFASRIAHYTSGSALLSQGEIVSRFASRNENGTLVWDIAALQTRQKALIAFAMENL